MTDLNKEDKIEKKSDPTKKDEKKELTLEEKLKDTEEKLLRSLAEIDNQRKRFEKDIQEALEFGGFNFAKENLVILDNLQRALDLADDILDEKSLPMIEGLELTKKDLLEVFKRNKIEKIEPLSGDKFDPQLHQAMMEAPSIEIEKGCIIQVLTIGFSIGDRLLRASNVTVSSGPTENIEEKVTPNLD